MAPKRFSLDEIRQLLGPMGTGQGKWFDLATDVRDEVRSTLRRDGFTEADLRVMRWNFDMYVTAPDAVVFDANCITFQERDYDGDLFETDLPFAVADGTITPKEWVDSVLAEMRARLTKRRIEREEERRRERAAREARERAEYERLAAKYGEKKVQ